MKRKYTGLAEFLICGSFEREMQLIIGDIVAKLLKEEEQCNVYT